MFLPLTGVFQGWMVPSHWLMELGLPFRYCSVRSALTQQSAELQDTRMLTEFLERVELEEGQVLHGSHGDNPGQVGGTSRLGVG